MPNGAIGMHLRKLEDAGYLASKRELVRGPVHCVQRCPRLAANLLDETWKVRVQQIIDLAGGDKAARIAATVRAAKKKARGELCSPRAVMFFLSE